MTLSVVGVLILLVGLMTLVSYVDRVYQEAGKFLSREFQDNIDVFEQKIEPKLGMSRSRASLAIAVLTQLTIALLLIVILCNRFLPFVFFSRTKGEWLTHWTPFLRVLLYLVRPVTLVL